MKKFTTYVAAVLIVLAAVLITVFVENKKISDLEAKHASDMEADRAEIDSLYSELQALLEDRQADREILTDLFR